ncbi:hypothetical protein FOL47_000806 [Perkinsus chesapeaki]|uniref:Uncharacterized protein n=1 Tax=Perkinsus chesapeaki TaxID=330153 RepID=A0A7J6KWN2_PERCH|nr:hypothetical protein FOL47_000806 [Perkinsus chesapeaki]
MTNASNYKRKLQGLKKPVNSGDKGLKEAVSTPPIDELELKKLGIDEDNVTRLVDLNQKKLDDKKENGDDDDDEDEVKSIGTTHPRVSFSNNARDFLKAFSNALCKSIKDGDSEPLPLSVI